MLPIVLRTIELALLVAAVLHAKRRGWLVARPRDAAGAVVLLILWLLLVWAVESRNNAAAAALPPSSAVTTARAR